MKMRHCVTAIILNFLLLLAAPAAFAAGDFSDVPPSHPNYKAIMDLKSRGIISGYPDNTFKPYQTVNRVEALKIILNGAKIDTTANATVSAKFTDIQTNAWYMQFLNKAVELGIVQGYPDGSFKPAQTVNLVENLKMLMEAKKIDMSKVVVLENPFADAPKEMWYAKYLQYAKDKKLIEGDDQNKIYPGEGLNRARLAEILYRLLYMEDNQLDFYPPTDPGSGTGTGPTLDINIQFSAFSKTEMTVGVGSTVRWTNNDSMPHTVTGVGNSVLNSPVLEKGQTYSYTFNQEGTFDYQCLIHPSMTGKIIVKPAIQVPTI
jgi:amicyanin